MKKIYSCCICHKELEEKPIRLTEQRYSIGNYKQYAPVKNYDFCKDCFRKFNAWIIKHKEGENK